MIKSALLAVCKANTARSRNIRRARFVVLSASRTRTVPGRQEAPESTNKSRWFSGYPGVPGTAEEKRRGKGLGRACRISWVHCHRKTGLWERVAHLRGVRLECKAIWGLMVQTPFRISFHSKPLAHPAFMAHRPQLCPPRWRRRSPYTSVGRPKYKAMGNATFSGLVLSAMRCAV